jgi:hypothetical protein
LGIAVEELLALRSDALEHEDERLDRQGAIDAGSSHDAEQLANRVGQHGQHTVAGELEVSARCGRTGKVNARADRAEELPRTTEGLVAASGIEREGAGARPVDATDNRTREKVNAALRRRSRERLIHRRRKRGRFDNELTLSCRRNNQPKRDFARNGVIPEHCDDGIHARHQRLDLLERHRTRRYQRLHHPAIDVPNRYSIAAVEQIAGDGTAHLPGTGDSDVHRQTYSL